ncbi:MAG: segregation/condensation protein A [Nitrospiraceae bacterium]
MEQVELPYHVRLDTFEGPLDLLLHLIKENRINIYDIPIALITQQYIDYLEQMRSLNLLVAGEFLVMAATLLHIKSRLLLPAEQRPPDEEDGPDPREELVRRLLEYKQFKEAARELDDRSRVWRDVYRREPEPLPTVEPESLGADDLTLFDLVEALQSIIARTPSSPLMEIIPDHLTVRNQMTSILNHLESTESATFTELFTGAVTRLTVIVTFLALLELIRLRTVRVYQAETFGTILVSRTFTAVGDDELIAEES